MTPIKAPSLSEQLLVLSHIVKAFNTWYVEDLNVDGVREYKTPRRLTLNLSRENKKRESSYVSITVHGSKIIFNIYDVPEWTMDVSDPDFAEKAKKRVDKEIRNRERRK